MRWSIPIVAFAMLSACGNGSGTDDGHETDTPSGGGAARTAGTQSDEAGSDTGSVDLSALPAPYAMANYDAGRRQFRRCGSCHTVNENGSHRVGPNLFGVFGREAGTAENFNYSPALREADFVWTPAQLDDWLANPREFLPGNRMSFVGLRDETDRRDVIAYLMHETGYASD